MTAPVRTGWRAILAKKLESDSTQHFIIGVIIFNAVILGLETDPGVMAAWGTPILIADRVCLTIFVIEISLKILTFRVAFFRDGWNLFDTAVVAIAFVPGAGPWSVLRSLRILRVLRLLTTVPSLKKVVAALLHAIPGLSGVIAVMGIFFYIAAVLTTQLFGASHPDWFGSMGKSLYSLFQIMTLESWSMGIVRPVMEVHPWAWAVFVPFIVIATFTILNLFLGIIVSTMQELDQLPETSPDNARFADLLERMEADLKSLREMTRAEKLDRK